MAQNLTINASGVITVVTISIVKRLVKGSELTYSEGDNNWDGSAKKYICVISANSGTADDLDTISGTSEGDEIIIRPTSGHSITVRHATGNLRLDQGTNYVLDNVNNVMRFMNTGLSDLQEIGRYGNI